MTQKRINLLGIRKKAVLCHFDGPRGGHCAVMESITDEEENYIDRRKCHKLFINDVVDESNIYFYGDINLDNEDDINLIMKKSLINENVLIRSNFNYDRGEHDVTDQVRCSVINSPIEWFKYNHCLIGKPAKVIVYKIAKAFLRQ